MKTLFSPRALSGRVAFLFFVALCLGFVPAQTFAQVTGTVFRDYNADGDQDAGEPGFAGIVVAAYAADGTTYGPVNSGADGTYSLPVPNGVEVRVEFTGLPTFLKSGPSGSGSNTSVAFATGSATVNFGVNNPAQYCENNPDMATACYVNGDPLAGGTSAPLDAFVSFPYDASGQWNPTPSATSPMPTHLARFDEVGSVWGVAYQRESKSIFASALMKRHVGFGSLGPSGIYKMDYNNPGAVQAWLKLSDLGISAGTDPRTGSEPNKLVGDFNQPSYDSLAFDAVGKVGIGDIDFSEGGDTLWVVNLFDKKLYALPVGNPAAIPAAPTVKSYQITDPGCDSGDYAPWGIEVHDGEVYVGVVCTAETSGDETDLRAHMMRLDGTAFTSVFDFGLNYNRAVVTNCCGQSSVTGEWEAWTNEWKTNASNNFQIYPQPILADMEIDSDGSIVFSLLDRHGHQTGRYNYQIDSSDPAVDYEGMAGGDILRACKVGGNYQLESNGQCPTGSATGASNGEGPGGGEYYFQDVTSSSDIHRDIVEGGLALLHGSGQVAATAFSPIDIRSGGTIWFNNNTGATDRRYEVYYRDMNGTFGKAAGLGDLELLCSAAPIQIGNRVWLDSDADGIQDAGEAGISGVTVSLYSGGGLVTSTTTNGDGEYYFNVNPNSTYEIRLDNNADFTSGPLQDYRATKANEGGNDEIDSDAVDVGGGVLGTSVSTGAAGANDHSYDFGFVEPASLGDYVWEDDDADGIQDAGESGIDGVTVKLLDASGTELSSTTTAGGGAYSFTNLIPDTYKVQFVKPSGYTPSPKDQGGDDAKDSDADVTTGITATTTLGPGDDDPTLDAGFYQPASLGDFVWIDTNNNGVQDSGESGIDGVTVRLLDPNDSFSVLETTTTSGGGGYLFDDLVPGDYVVEFVLPSGHIFSPQDQGGDDAKDSDADTSTGRTTTITLAAGDNDLTIDAGLVPTTASLGNYVWFDTDKDGVQDGSEDGVEGVTVTLFKDGVSTGQTDVTDSDGEYAFETLAPGNYHVVFSNLPANTAFTTADQGGDDAKDSDANTGTGATAAVSLAVGENNTTLDAGIISTLASLGDFVWIDTNNNGIQDSGENGLDGVTVRLLDPNDSFSVLETTTTSGGGGYLFDDLVPSDYVVEFVLPSGYVFSPQDAGSDDAKDSDANTSTGRTTTITLAAGENNLTIDAGLVQTNASLGDFVWYDLDIDGIQDAGEPAAENVTVRLLDPNDSFSVLGTTTTNASGAYAFNNLAPGDYVVEFVLPANHNFTAKDEGGDDAKDSDANTSTGRTPTVTLAGGENNPTLDAGIFPKISPVLECVRDNGNGTYTASWGYNNPTPFTFTIPVGPLNSFNPAPEDRGQPTVFAPGRDFNAFTVTTSNATTLVWKLTGKTGTAGSGSSACSLADLELEKTVDNAAPALGSNVTFTLTLTNNGPYANSFPAEVTDVLPAGLTYVSHTLTPNTGSYDDATGVWSTSTESGAPLELAIVASADQLGTIENCAQVTDAAKLDPDSDPNNDDGDASEDDESCASITVSSSRIDLEVTKTVSDPAPDVSDVVTYTVTVVNKGNVNATDVDVTDTLPGGVAFDGFVGVPPGSANHAASVITWEPPTIGYVGCTGGSCEPSTFTLEYTATISSSGTHTNCAEVTAANETDLDSTPNDGIGDDRDCATVTTDGSSGGGGAGVESNGDMSSVLATRLFNRRQDVQEQRALLAAPEPVLFTPASTALVAGAAKSGSTFDIAEIVSNDGPQTSQAFVTTPSDIVLVTNATSVFAADYIRTDGKRIGALFGATTPATALYDHTKVTCDRLGGARLTEVSTVEVDGRTFILSEHRHANGELDYAVSFIIHRTGNSYTVDSRFVPDAYQLQSGSEEIINMQVWSVSPEFTVEMVSAMMAKLDELGDVAFINEGAAVPEVPALYVSGGTYENGILNLDFTNWGEATSIVVEGTTSQTETAAGQQSRTPFSYTVQVPTSTADQPFVTAAIDLGPLYDISFTVESVDGTVYDRAYYGDGPWGFAQGNATVSSFETFAVDSTLATTPTDDFRVERNATITGDVTNWVSLFRYLRPNGQAVNLSSYENVEFTAYGLGTVQFYVEKASITDGNQYGFNIRLNAQPTRYTIALDDLRQLTGNAGFTAEDVTSLVYYVTGNGRNSQPFFLVLEDVRFTGSSNSVAIEEDDLFEQPETYTLEQNYPNPFNPQTTIAFNVPTASEVRLTVFDMLGREIQVLANGVVPSGRHEVVFEAGNLPSGTYLYRLQAAGETITKKLVLMK